MPDDYTPNLELLKLDGRRTSGAYCRKHRLEILGDIGAILEQSPGAIEPMLRWSDWERDVLTKLPAYADLEEEIVSRQKAVDDDQDDKDLIIEFFRGKLEEWKHNPDSSCVLISSSVIAEWVSAATRKSYATNQASAFVRSLGISYLSRSDRNGQRNWLWTGPGCTERDPVKLDAWVMTVIGSGGSDGGSGGKPTIAYRNPAY